VSRDARRVAWYMAKPIVALTRLSFNEDQGKVVYRYGKGGADKVASPHYQKTEIQTGSALGGRSFTSP
jgi:hypothetical protein